MSEEMRDYLVYTKVSENPAAWDGSIYWHRQR